MLGSNYENNEIIAYLYLTISKFNVTNMYKIKLRENVGSLNIKIRVTFKNDAELTFSSIKRKIFENYFGGSGEPSRNLIPVTFY